MYDLYTWGTPNGRKVSIMLEELELSYEVKTVNITKDEQFSSEFLEISPNNKIPALVDRDNECALMESGAILIYLADKTKKLLIENRTALDAIAAALMEKEVIDGEELERIVASV